MLSCFNLTEALARLENITFGPVMIFLILTASFYLTYKSGGVQFRHLKKAFGFLKGPSADSKTGISSYQALCTALAATLGTGNIVGVATAVTAGGPGALFWMVLASIFGMATTYSEGLLAVKFRRKNGKEFFGGPFLYIEEAFRRAIGKDVKLFSKLFAFFGTAAGITGIGTMTQINSISDAANLLVDSKTAFFLGEKEITVVTLLVAITISLLAAVVIFGGIKRIASVSSFVVPFMTVFYLFFSLVIIFTKIEELPTTLSLVVKSAFSGKAVIGSVVGVSVREAIQKGVSRGVFSNEAGLGTSAIASAAAETDSAVKQGLVSMLGTFIDTVVICSITGLVIIMTGSHLLSADTVSGFNLTATAWNIGLPILKNSAVSALAISLIFFAFATIIGWNYYSEQCLEYLLGRRSKRAVMIFRILYILSVFVGPFFTVESVFSLATVFNGLMSLPNLLGLFLLGDVVKDETCKFFKKGIYKSKAI